MPSSPVRVHHQLGSGDEKSRWLWLLLGYCRYEPGPPSLCAGYCMSLPLLCYIDSQWLRLTQSCVTPMVWDPNGVPTKQPRMLGVLIILPEFSFPHWGKQRLRGYLSVQCWPGEGPCGQCAAASLTLLMQSVLVSCFGARVLQLHTHVLEFSVVSYPWIVG